MEFNNTAEDLAINGRELDLKAEEFWVNKDEKEYYEYLDEEERRRIWAKLDLDNYKFQIFKNHCVFKLELPKNIAWREYKREISFFSLFLRKFGQFIFKHEVLNQQYKHRADDALKEAWDNYKDS